MAASEEPDSYGRRKPPASILAGVTGAKGGSSLKKTTTKVRTRDGKIFEERRGDDGGMVSEFKGTEVLPTFLTEASVKSLPWFQYSEESKKWARCEAEDSPMSASSSSSSSTAPVSSSDLTVLSDNQLKVISYNVWFVDREFEARLTKLLEILAEEQADIVCLQEVTPRFLAIFLRDKFIQSHYSVTDSTAALTVNPYGVIICVSRMFRVKKVNICNLASTMGRRLVQCELVTRMSIKDSLSSSTSVESTLPSSLSELSLWVNTVHLESMLNTEARIGQLKNIFEDYIKPGTNALFMGDTNFGDGREENEHIPAEFKDCWVEWGTLNEKNLLRDGLTCGGERLDKMYHRMGQDGFEADTKEFQLLGKPNMPSDHLGILSVFKLRV